MVSNNCKYNLTIRLLFYAIRFGKVIWCLWIIFQFSYSKFKDINTAPKRDAKLDTKLHGAVPEVAPVSKMDEGTVGSLLAQDSRWYHTKIESQIKQNQALLMHLQQELARLEIDRSNRSGGFMVCRSNFVYSSTMLFNLSILYVW